MSHEIRMGVTRVRLCAPKPLPQNAVCVLHREHTLWVYRTERGELAVMEAGQWLCGPVKLHSWKGTVPEWEWNEIISKAAAEKLDL